MNNKQLKSLNKILLSFSIAGLLSACNLASHPSNNSVSSSVNSSGSNATSQNMDEISFANSLQSPQRSATDKARDEGRKPQQVMQFFGIEKGMTVLEIVSTGGYYTEVLSHRVGTKGKVIAHNNKFILEVFDGRFSKEFEQRTADNRLANVEHYIKEFGQFDLNAQADVVTIVLNYHDLYSNIAKDKRMNLLSQIKRALKPGGIIGIIDMEANSGAHQSKLHRVYHQHVLDELIEAGFIFDAQADFLKNSDDDHSKVVFDPSIRGKTDRFVFRFRKPMV
ncbi:MAG: class I SAM-dependent methyltransferase [Colwellia sp.]|nr:class I SAM-dependent methyltransferase [Colwellia sp.]